MWLDAVLPLTLRDAARAELLFDSLAQNFTGLRRLWVVCPDAQRAELAARYRSRRQPFELCVESELQVVPEFALQLKFSGWFRQQLIKLAIFERIESELYLTFDADVVCSRAVNAEQLVGNGRGACFVMQQAQHDYWYQRVERVLRVRAPRRGVMHNVTPALLHRRAVDELRRALEDKIARHEYSQGLRGWKQRWALARTRQRAGYAAWRVYLAAARPWTEYALYYTFLETSGRFERYHYYAPQCIYDVEHSLWQAANAELPGNWDPSPAFSGEGPPWFLVAQSNTGISAKLMRDKLEPLLKGSASEIEPSET
jgi:Family of unknown function (DUF6492)